MTTHTASVVAHVNDLIIRARARGNIVTALDLDGTRFELIAVEGDGVLIRGFKGQSGDQGRYCRRWQEETVQF